MLGKPFCNEEEEEFRVSVKSNYPIFEGLTQQNWE
jgi:hypothetical protein